MAFARFLVAAFQLLKPHDEAGPLAEAWSIRRVVAFEIKIKSQATRDWQCAGI